MKHALIACAALIVLNLSCVDQKRVSYVYRPLHEPIKDTTPVVDTTGGKLKLSEKWKQNIKEAK